MKVRPLFLPASLIMAFGLSMLLAACASSGSGATIQTTPSAVSKRSPAPASATGTAPAAARAGTTQPAVEGGEIKVTLKNNTFPEEIRVKAGAKVVFVITNEGDEKHSFEFPDLGVYKEIPAGRTARVEWTVPDRKGRWDMGCFLTDPDAVHERMEGTLIIE